MIIGIQIIAILFALVMAYLSYTHYKRREFNAREILLWMLFWLGFIFITVFPHSLDFIVHTFQLTRVLDLVMIVGFMVLIALVFRNYVVMDKLAKKLEQLVRSDALRALDDGTRSDRP